MKKLLLGLSMCCIAVYSQAAFQTIYGRDVIITDTIESDLYISAGTVRIDAPVQGDIFVCGGTVSINSTVSGDVLVVGGELIFNGEIDGSLRCAGGKLTISGIIDRDLVVASGDIVCDKKSFIYGGILGVGGNLSIDGTVKQNVQTYANYTSILGTVDGDVNCKGETIFIGGAIKQTATLSAVDLQIGDSATFQTGVHYWDADLQVDFKNSLFGKKPVYDKSLEIKASQWKFLGFSAIIYLCWYLLAGLFSIIFFHLILKRFLKDAANKNHTFSWRSFGYGSVFMLILPVAICLLFISIIGIPIVFLFMVLFILIGLFNNIILGLFYANCISNTYGKGWNRMIVAVAFGLFILLKLISSIPILGWIALFIMNAFALGAIIRVFFNKTDSNKAATIHH